MARGKGRETVLILRTCKADMTAHGGFKWPTKGTVEAPDWNPAPCCGGGLHGLLWGEGDGVLLDWSEDAKWLVVRAAAADVVAIDSAKVKIPRGEVVYCGDRKGATDYLQAHGGAGMAIVGAFVVAGYSGTATAGDSGTATAGYSGTATAGYCGTATAGDSGTATAGDYGTATAGYSGTATAGYSGTATAGYSGTATAGYSGTATAGDYGTATAGYSGTATAGARGTIAIKRWDGSRYRLIVGYVGEGGIEANVAYRLNDRGAFVRADGR